MQIHIDDNGQATLTRAHNLPETVFNEYNRHIEDIWSYKTIRPPWPKPESDADVSLNFEVTNPSRVKWIDLKTVDSLDSSVTT